MAERSGAKSANRGFAQKYSEFLRRSYASRYELRFAPLFLAKSKSTTNWSLYPKGLTLALKFCVTLTITITITLTLTLTLTPALKKRGFFLR